jgi:hypothetical protein
VLSLHGDERTDDWFWLRERDDPDVLAYLEAENAYADATLAPYNALAIESSKRFAAESRKATSRRRFRRVRGNTRRAPSKACSTASNVAARAARIRKRQRC